MTPSQDQWSSTDQQAPAPAGDWSSTDDHAAVGPKSWLDHATDYARGAWSQLNPAAVVKGAAQVTAHPIDAVRNIAASHGATLQKAEDAFKRGDYLEGVRHTLGYIIPVIGPQIDTMGDKAGSGQLAEALGEASGLGVSMAAPGVAARAAAPAKIKAAAQAAGEGIYRKALRVPPMTDTGQAATAVKTGLSHEIPINPEGLKRLDALVSDLNDSIQRTLQANPSKRTVDPRAVATRTNALRDDLAQQVNPVDDLKAVDRSTREFLEQRGERPGVPAQSPQPTGVLDATGQPVMTPGAPAKPPTPARPMTPTEAQALKVGTYRQLKGKYDKLGAAQVESQKALARGIKEELANIFPEIGAANATEGKLLDLQPYIERRVNMAANAAPAIFTGVLGGVGGAAMGGLEGGAVGSVGLVALKHVLTDPSIQSRLAINLYRAGGAKTISAARSRIAEVAQGLGAARPVASAGEQ